MADLNDRSGADLKPYSLEHIANQSFDQEAQVSMVEPLTYDPTSGELSRAFPANALNLKPYDYASRTVNSATVTWTFNSGGAGGTTNNTVVIVYTDFTLQSISTITKT